MRDAETGSYWQQISGRAIAGPLKGKTLNLVHSDEISFGLWSREEPSGRVLAAVPEAQSHYEKKDWEARYAKLPTVIAGPPDLNGRELVLGIKTQNASRAYPYDKVRQQKLIADSIGATAVIVVLGPDNLSVRAFENRLPSTQKGTDFYRTAKAGDSEFALTDSETGSEWDFRGCALAGPLRGTCLRPIEIIKDHWFDWAHYNPDTTVYAR